MGSFEFPFDQKTNESSGHLDPSRRILLGMCCSKIMCQELEISSTFLKEKVQINHEKKGLSYLFSLTNDDHDDCQLVNSTSAAISKPIEVEVISLDLNYSIIGDLGS